jgi:luciferase-like monooxygenase
MWTVRSAIRDQYDRQRGRRGLHATLHSSNGLVPRIAAISNERSARRLDESREDVMEIGIDSFAAAFDERSLAVSASVRLRQLIEQIEHADEVGQDAFGVGEQNRREFLDSAPAVILGAAAVRTQRIRLTSAVTVLSAEDPVRAFQNFATIDLLSGGRAEMVVGRGSSLSKRFRSSVIGWRTTTHSLKRSLDSCSRSESKNTCTGPASFAQR